MLCLAETFVTCKIFDKVFNMPGFRRKDKELKLGIAALQWIDFCHLDMPAACSDFKPAWELAMEALCEINNYRGAGTVLATACMWHTCG